MTFDDSHSQQHIEISAGKTSATENVVHKMIEEANKALNLTFGAQMQNLGQQYNPA